MARLTLQNVDKSFGAKRIIDNFNLEIEDEEFIVLVGPSGCGKSTLLRMIAGLEDVSAGEITIDGERINERDPSAREIAMVFQSYALYPHMSARENIAFSLKMEKKLAKKAVAMRVSEAAKVLRLENVLTQKPKELSGGQKQRVAIGRAFVRHPKIFLFDEPLSNLDAELRVEMRLEIAKLREAVKATMLYVTHDQVEAMTLADRIVVLRNGIIEQVGSPSQLYLHPNNRFVAEFIGSPKMNFLTVHLVKVTYDPQDGATYTVAFPAPPQKTNAATAAPPPTLTLSVPAKRCNELAIDSQTLQALAQTPLHLGCRPESIIATPAPAATSNKSTDPALTLTSEIEVMEYLGNLSYLYTHNPYATSELGALIVKVDAAAPFTKHMPVTLHFPQKYLHLFTPTGQALL